MNKKEKDKIENKLRLILGETPASIDYDEDEKLSAWGWAQHLKFARLSRIASQKRLKKLDEIVSDIEKVITHYYGGQVDGWEIE